MSGYTWVLGDFEETVRFKSKSEGVGAGLPSLCVYSELTPVRAIRYTDFMVNEILQSGEVLHLRSVKVPASLRRDAQKASAQNVEEPVKDSVAESKAEATTEAQQQDAETAETPVQTTDTPSAEDAKAVPEV